MQETNIIARVIQTMSQSFIEANIEKICHVITNINPINNKNISITFLDNGGFEFINLEAQTSNRFVGAAFKDKDDVFTKLNDFFKKKNEIFSQFFKNTNNDSVFPFFPIQYMKPIVIFPNYEKGKFGQIVKSWTALYKIEIAAYENPTTKRYEYSNIINSGIEITVSSSGQIIGLKYNLLPLELRKGSPLFKVIADENEIPQLAYLLNKETSTVAPFYLSTTEEAYIPATKESILASTNNSNLSLLNDMDFDRNRIVVWLKKIGINKKLKIKDSSAISEQTNSNIFIPVGTKVIRLKPNNEKEENTPCFFWWQGSYHQSSFPELNIGNNNVVLSSLSSKVLKNDIEHLLNRIKSYEGVQSEFDVVIKSIKNFSKKELSKKQIEDGLVVIATKLKINFNDKPSTINNFVNSIFQVYNPSVDASTKFSEECLVIPLTFEWFSSDPKLLERYKTVWETSSVLVGHFVIGGKSGDILNFESDLAELRDELLQLKDFVKQTSISESPEAKWLNTLSEASLSHIKRAIFINDLTWKLTPFDRYGDYVAIENSFGVFRLPPIICIIIHEMTVTGGVFLKFASGTDPNGYASDSHISDDYTKATWEKATQGGLGVIEKNQDYLDHLYQSHRAYATIALRIIIHQISGL